MSEDKRFRGKIKKVETNGLSIEEWRKENDYIDDDTFYDYYIVINDSMYEITQLEEMDSCDSFVNIIDNKDGTLSFITQFYNGGTCLSEMLEEGMTKIKQC